MRQLTSLDAQFLAMENGRTQGHVSILGVFDAETASGRPLDAALVRELVTARMHLLPTFRWRLAPVPFGLDHPYWVDDGTFDVEYHVQDAALPAPGTQRQLADLVAHLIGRQLDRARPLWELYVIQGLEDGSVAVLTKMHHAAVDGVSGAEVLSVLLDDSATGRELEAAPAGRGGAVPVRSGDAGPRSGRDVAPATAGVEGSADHVASPRRRRDASPRARGEDDRARAAEWSSGPCQCGNGGSALQGNDLVAPRTRFQTRISAHRRVAFESMSLDDVKMIKNTFGCTVNDVVLAICTAGLRSWLDERGELPAESLLGFIPMSVRTPEQMGTFGNRVSVMITELPTETADPVKRLRRINESMKSVKDRHNALPASLMQDANHFIPPALLAQAGRATSRLVGVRGIKQPVNVVISNVPGSPTPMYLGGARQRAQFPISGVLDGIGLNITVFSYQDSLEFGIVVDREQLDDPWPLLDAMRAGLDELRDLRKNHSSPVRHLTQKKATR